MAFLLDLLPAVAVLIMLITLTSPVLSRGVQQAQDGVDQSAHTAPTFLTNPSDTLVTPEKPAEIECKVGNSDIGHTNIHFVCDGKVFIPTSTKEYTEATVAWLEIEIWQADGIKLACKCIAKSDGARFESKVAIIQKACK